MSLPFSRAHPRMKVMSDNGTRKDQTTLEGQVLIAMPGMSDPRFQKSLVYVCTHGEDGAMGLIVNKRAERLTVAALLRRLDLPASEDHEQMPVRYGGPVETMRGFVLHSADYPGDEGTLQVDDEVSMSFSMDVLRDIAEGNGPRRVAIALGYSGWAPGQLEGELQMNGWLYCPPDEEMLFGDEDGEEKWDKALAKIGVDPALLGAGGTA